MRICVAGWYFDKQFVQTMSELPQYQPFFVCHKPVPPGFPLDFSVIRNIGLEFGCYDHFLTAEWKEGSVLFLHDDTRITPEAVAGIEKLDCDQAFLFASEADAQANGKAHGRAIFCSDKLLNRLFKEGGFWYDEGPIKVDCIPATSSVDPDYHNIAIQTFRAWLEELPQDEFKVNQVVVVEGLKTGYRGRL